MRALPLVFVLLTACGGSPTQNSKNLNLAGTWTLQTRASTSCANSLPADSRNRSYSTVVMTQSNGIVTGSITTGLGSFGAFVFVGSIAGSRLDAAEFSLTDTTGVSGEGVQGSFTGTATSTTITGTLVGFFQATNVNSPICFAADHSIAFTKR